MPIAHQGGEVTDGLAVAPSMDLAAKSAAMPRRVRPFDQRIWFMCLLAIVLGVIAAWVAQALTALIHLATNVAFFGRIDTVFRSPADHARGLFVLAIPSIGGLIVGLMARFGSSAIRGHGIPEAMDQVLSNQSRIPARMTLLKPMSSAVAIGTGGPFGAEGPIIATGGALGSVLGQLLRTTADERKVLLASGAAAGMAATFGSPIAALLLAVELLLFEFRARSLVPAALAATTAALMRIQLEGSHPAFALPTLPIPSAIAIVTYVFLGGCIGLISVGVVWATYAVEDSFEHLPMHWMWWPALGGIAVGLIGYIAPHTLGVGYDNIENIAAGRIVGVALFTLVGLKFLSWVVALGSGTSGGTLAPLFTVGGGIGALLGAFLEAAFPSLDVDPRMAALIGMAALFAGASRAPLASTVFMFEATWEMHAILPLLGASAAAYLVARSLQDNSIMTEKLVRRGTKVPAEYSADALDQLPLKAVATREVVTLKGSQSLGATRTWLAGLDLATAHQGYPVIDDQDRLLGVLTRRDFLAPGHPDDATLQSIITRPSIVVNSEGTLRDAVNLMVEYDVGRVPLVSRQQPSQVVGMVTRSDILKAQRVGFMATLQRERKLTL